jgi:hypothetical protein
MKRFLILIVLALAVPATALAKGASEATIEGPGLHGTIIIPGNGEPGGGTPLGQIADLAGFFPAVFPAVPNPMLQLRPHVRLGPRYVVRYTMPGPNGSASIIEQDLYPYATPYPVVYTPPGQPFWGGQHTFGGWYSTTTELKIALEGVGLPENEPTGGDGGFWSSPPRIAGIAGGLAVVILAALGALVAVRRRRLHPAPSS